MTNMRYVYSEMIITRNSSFYCQKQKQLQTALNVHNKSEMFETQGFKYGFKNKSRQRRERNKKWEKVQRTSRRMFDIRAL